MISRIDRAPKTWPRTYGGKQGRVASRATSSSTGPSFNASFTWNDLGQAATVTYPGCTFSPCNAAPGPVRTVTSNYTNGYLTSVGGFTNTITYHPNGLTNAIPHLNGMTVTQANDPFKMMRPASITATVGAATPWASGTYAYDGAGNIKGIGSNFYYYDLVSRVVDGTAEYTSGSIHKRQTYGYDPYGNMKTIGTIVNGAAPTTLTLLPSSTTNRLTNSGTTYDDSGNMTAWGTSGTPIWLYGFDGLNMMQSNNNGVRTRRYVYTADDERIAVYDATAVRWTWRLRGVDNKVLREYRQQGSTWTWQKDHVYRGSSLLASDEPTIGVRHFALDHLGTIRLITSSTGTTVSTHNYYPFGQEATSETQDAEAMKFTGHERDTEFNGTGGTLDYMHARYYGPSVGRFLSVDPGDDWQLERPQSLNLYGYTAGNPVTFTDPDGKARLRYFLQTLKGFRREITRAKAVRESVAGSSRRHSVSVRGDERARQEAYRVLKDANPKAKVEHDDAHQLDGVERALHPNDAERLNHWQTKGGNRKADVGYEIVKAAIGIFGGVAGYVLDAEAVGLDEMEQLEEAERQMLMCGDVVQDNCLSTQLMQDVPRHGNSSE